MRSTCMGLSPIVSSENRPACHANIELLCGFKSSIKSLKE